MMSSNKHHVFFIAMASIKNKEWYKYSKLWGIKNRFQRFFSIYDKHIGSINKGLIDKNTAYFH